MPPNGHEPNPALRLLYRRFFDPIQVDENWVTEVRELAQRGTVVYVLRNLSVVDFLALDHLTKRFKLPRIRYANDLRLGLLDPMSNNLIHALTRGSRTAEREQLRTAIAENHSAALFLKRPPGVLAMASGTSAGRGLKEGDDHIQTLMDLQRERERPILLVPQLFVWTNRPDTHGSQLLDFVVGPREWPSNVRTVAQFLQNYRHVELRAGEALNLAEYMASVKDGEDELHVRRIVYALLRRLERERRTATGPAQKAPDRQRLQILRSPKLQTTVTQMAGERDEHRRALQQRSLKMLRAMQATPDTATIQALEILLDRVFHRIYAGIEVDTDGLRRLRELIKEGSIVLLPSHKSHVDYLVLSFILYQHNLQLPMIAAGDNLSFFPLGPVLRRAGGFFIRRSFRGDKLYSATVEAYVRRLLRDGYTLELFLEGGRSRTGKLLEPKLGLLAMIVDAATSVSHRPVHFLPVSIGYERIVETQSYEHELSGGEKQREDATGLLKSTEVLRHRYGRINVQFGEPRTLAQVRAELGLPTNGDLSPDKQRAVVTRLANRTMDEINNVTAVTPGALTALALLSDRHRSLAHEDLVVRCQKLVRLLYAMGARITPRTATGDVLRPEAVREAVQMFVDADLLEALQPGDVVAEERQGSRVGEGAMYRIPERKRLELDTSKNHIVHFFVERGLVALSVLHVPGPPVEVDTVRERVRNLSKLFKREFRFRADAPFERIFDETLQAMIEDGELIREGASVIPGPGRDDWTGQVWLSTYALILANFVEGYRVAARSLTHLVRGPMTEKDLVKRALAVGNRMYLAGDIESREAVTKPLVQNALRAFVEAGYARVADGKYALTQSFDNQDAVNAIEGRLAGFTEPLAR